MMHNNQYQTTPQMIRDYADAFAGVIGLGIMIKLYLWFDEILVLIK